MPPDLDDDIDDMVSVTLARIFAAQEEFEEAARVFDKLAIQDPENAEDFRQQAREMRSRINGGDIEEA